MLIRPGRWPEAIWAVAGSGFLVICRLITPSAALRAVGRGTDVYLFLSGMMIISELARRAGVFDWCAGCAVRAARGSATRLFFLVYAVGTVVTVLLSNDATAVVLTPAVFAAVRAAGAEPLPYLMSCAFIANAASFVLPISNPANLVVYDGSMPPLATWLLTFGLASLAAVVVTFLALRAMAARYLKTPVRTALPAVTLRREGWLALLGIGFLAAVLLVASALNQDLGAPACGAGLVVAIAIGVRDRSVWKQIVRGVSWSVLPLVAGLFVIVEALNQAGALHRAVDALNTIEHWRPFASRLTASAGIALISNLMNNLPSGLIGSAAMKAAHVTGTLRDSVLIGVDLGPNLSVTGSLATILWLIAIRREGLNIKFWDFLKWGVIVTPPALVAATLLLF